MQEEEEKEKSVENEEIPSISAAFSIFYGLNDSRNITEKISIKQNQSIDHVYIMVRLRTFIIPASIRSNNVYSFRELFVHWRNAKTIQAHCLFTQAVKCFNLVGGSTILDVSQVYLIIYM